MNCDRLKSFLAELFDLDKLDAVPQTFKTHLQQCSNCQNYYLSLKKLEKSIGHLTIFSENESSLDSEINRIQYPQLQRQRGQLLRRKWLLAAAALFFMAIISLFSQLLFNYPFSPPNPSISEFHIYSVEVGDRSTKTIIFQSEEENKPLIIWFY